MRAGRLALLALAVLSGAATLGCEQLLGEPFGKKFAFDAGSKSTPPPSTDPFIPDPSDVSAPPLFFAIRNIDFGEVGTDTIGYDIDLAERCTRVPARGGLPTESVDGKDNAIAALARDYLNNRGITTSQRTSMAVAPGGLTTIFRVAGYNGGSEDPEVFVAVVTGAFAPAANPSKSVPAWDGADLYQLDVASFSQLDAGRYAVRAEAKGSISDFHLHVSHDYVYDVGMFDAVLEQGDGRYELRGTAGGVLEAGVYAQLVAQGSLCVIDLEAPTATADRARFCGTRDVTTDGRPGTCNAFSAGYAFDAVQVQIDGARAFPPPCVTEPLVCPM